MPDTKPKLADENKPPVFQTWNQVYAFVLIAHIVIITLFYIFKITYS